MKNWMKAIVAIGVIIIIALIITLTMFIIYKISLDPIYNYISAIASLIVILLMLITIIFTDNSTNEYIKSVEDSTKKQIESWERWELLQRKQTIKSLIAEFKFNLFVYNSIRGLINTNIPNRAGVANNFILTSLERSLSKSPFDDDQINNNLLKCYYRIKTHDNVLIDTRTSNSREEFLNWINFILNEFETSRQMFENTIRMIQDYEERLE